MRYPTQPEENMMTAVLQSVSEEAVRLGVGTGCFHGFEFRAVRLGRRVRCGAPACIRVVVRQDGEVIESLLLDASSSRMAN